MEPIVTSEERELVLLLKQGNAAAFNQLYKRHGRWIFARLKGLIHHREIVEELHQDVFLKVWEGRDRIDPDVAFQAILTRTARSIAIDFYRKAVRDQRLREQLIRSATELYDHLNDLVEFNETNHALSAAIEKLPAQRRQVFLLVKMEGKSYQYAASHLGVSLSTIKDHMAKATAFIRRELIQYNPSVFFALIISALFK